MLGGVDYIMYDVLLQLPILIVRYCSKIVFDFIRETLLIVQNRKRVRIFLGSDLLNYKYYSNRTAKHLYVTKNELEVSYKNLK